jgi:hypothetical protein
MNRPDSGRYSATAGTVLEMKTMSLAMACDRLSGTTDRSGYLAEQRSSAHTMNSRSRLPRTSWRSQPGRRGAQVRWSSIFSSVPGNTLYWILRGLPAARGPGFELDDRVFALTQQNAAALNLSIGILNTDYRSGLAGVSATSDELLIAFIAPHWGDGFDPVSGLDLRRTTPHDGRRDAVSWTVAGRSAFVQGSIRAKSSPATPGTAFLLCS